MTIVIGILLFIGLCVISDQLKDIYTALVEIANRLGRSDIE